MSSAAAVLRDLATIGAIVQPAGTQLILRAGPRAIPGPLVRRTREAKADLIAILTDGRVIRWLNQHPAPSKPGCCAWCQQTEFTECRRASFRHRTRHAYVASRRMLARLASMAQGRSGLRSGPGVAMASELQSWTPAAGDGPPPRSRRHADRHRQEASRDLPRSRRSSAPNKPSPGWHGWKRTTPNWSGRGPSGRAGRPFAGSQD